MIGGREVTITVETNGKPSKEALRNFARKLIEYVDNNILEKDK